VTIEIRIGIDERLSDALVAELADVGFVAFAREDAATVGWGPPAALTADIEGAIRRWLDRHAPGASIEKREWPDQNWNASWEASIEPVAAGPFVILPSWADVPTQHLGRLPLRIDPKMSFGTGHHASTRLALRLVADVVKPGSRVLDVGCGTGVLALGALTIGAGRAVGCDIDEWSVPNARECADLNGLSDRFDVREGGLEVVPESGFDLVVANIIRSTLLEMLPDLRSKLAPGGFLVLAGLMDQEREEMVAAARAVQLDLFAEDSDEGWWAGLFAHAAGGSGPRGQA
jgi:ribosomal protein L11 methyltransferase